MEWNPSHIAECEFGDAQRTCLISMRHPVIFRPSSSISLHPRARVLHGGGMGDQRALARPSAGADGFVGVAWTPRSVWFAGM